MFAIAIIIGVVVGAGLTMLLRPRPEFEACVAKEMKGQQPQIDLLNVQRICAQPHGTR
jgi:hypothetical protein